MTGIVHVFRTSISGRVQAAWKREPFGTGSEFARAVVDVCLTKYEEDATELFPELTYLCAQIAQKQSASDEYGRLLQATGQALQRALSPQELVQTLTEFPAPRVLQTFEDLQRRGLLQPAA